MNKIILSFLYLSNIVFTVLTGFSLLAICINGSMALLFLIFSTLELIIFVLTIIYIILYSKKINNLKKD